MASKAPLVSTDLGIFSKVLKCYTATSGAELARIFNDIYTANATFNDPFVVATPRVEARLQFLSLQHLFERITALAGQTSTSDDEIRAEVHFEYFWRRESWLSQKILPEVTPVDATVVLNLDSASGKIISHTDEWHSPSVPKLPDLARKLNVKAMNGVFRLLGWEKELEEGQGESPAMAATRKEE